MRWPRLLLVWAASLGVRAEPVKFVPAELDFGPAGQGLHLEAEVQMINTSGRDLVVLGVTSDCSCAAGEPRQPRLRPGEATRLPVGMDTRTYLGPVLRRLTVQTNAGDAELRVRATIRLFASWDVTPNPTFFSPSLRLEAANLSLTATYLGSDRKRVLGASADQPWLQAELSAPQSGDTTRVHLRKLPEAPSGPHTAVVSLRTDDPDQPILAIKVYVPVLSAATVLPHPVILPATRVGQSASREIAVSGWDESTPPLLRLPAGQIEPRGRRPNGDFVFVLTVTPAQPGMNTQKLQLTLDEGQVLLEVPVLIKGEPRP